MAEMSGRASSPVSAGSSPLSRSSLSVISAAPPTSAALPGTSTAPPGSPDECHGKISFVVGIVSDTHGQFHPRVGHLLAGADHIIHAGDVGSEEVLRALKALAPVTVVRGNCDCALWATALPVVAEVELAGVQFSVRHAGRPQPFSTAAWSESVPRRLPRVVVTGHTHLAAVEWHEGVLYVNPGSAGPRRFGRPRTLARVEIVKRPGAEPEVVAEILTAED